MFAPNILVVENKRVVLGEVCRNLSVAFAEVHPPFILFCPVFILLSSFSLLFSLSFFLLHALFSPFHPSRFLWAHICAHPLVILLSPFSLLFSLSFFLLHALFSPFHPSRSLWAHICAHPLVILLSAFSLIFFLSFSFGTLFFLLFILPVPFGRIFAPTR